MRLTPESCNLIEENLQAIAMSIEHTDRFWQMHGIEWLDKHTAYISQCAYEIRREISFNSVHAVTIRRGTKAQTKLAGLSLEDLGL